MVILLTGLSGFIGSHLAQALRAAGHTVIGTTRLTDSDVRTIRVDFAKDIDPNTWLARLSGIDVVINAVGILRESPGQTFEALHTRAPQALFQACALANVQRVIQISALGADSGTSDYFRSKRAADEFLATLPLDWTIVQPSIVYGAAGASAKLFTGLASLPAVPVPGDGTQRVQPIHIDDLTSAIVNSIDDSAYARRKIALVGPRPLELRTMLLELRNALGLRSAPLVPIPMLLMRLAAFAGAILPSSPLDRDTLTMLEAGNTADAADTHAMLGRAPRGVGDFVARDARTAILHAARLQWLLPLLRGSIAAVWIWTAIVSLGLYPRDHSLTLLEQAGIAPANAPLILNGAATLDLILGLATLFMRQRRGLWLVQISLIVVYTTIITIALPAFWLNPFGPILKNLPMLAAIYLLYVLEEPQWNTSS